MSSPPFDELNRRDLLKAAAAAGIASKLGLSPTSDAQAAPAAFAPTEPDRIRTENEQPGTRDWLATNVRIDPATKYRSPWIEGYASRTRVRPGESIDLYVSTNPASPFVIDLYRMGYYQGHGGRHMLRLGPFPGTVQPEPPVGELRLRECQWEPCVTLTIPADWTSGVYLGKLTAEREGLQSYLIFIVRDDRRADLMFQCSDTTWNAYNRWPDNYSLYRDGKKTGSSYWGPDVASSFDRPYGKYCQLLDAPLSVGSGEFLLWEFPFAYWAEQQGFDLTYISNVDTHADPAGLRRAKGLLSIGHDEYWSLAMYKQVQQAIAEGLNVGFFSGNSVCGVTAILPSSDGRPDRVLQRVGRFGSPQQIEIDNGFPEEALFRHNGPNENLLIGARSVYPTVGGADWICRLPEHWIFADTGMQAGDGIPGLVGWEWHGEPAGIPGLEVVARGTTESNRGPGEYTATVYPGPKGNFVFNAATCWWADGLSEPPGYLRAPGYVQRQGPDPRVQQITRNILQRMVAGPG